MLTRLSDEGTEIRNNQAISDFNKTYKVEVDIEVIPNNRNTAKQLRYCYIKLKLLSKINLSTKLINSNGTYSPDNKSCIFAYS